MKTENAVTKPQSRVRRLSRVLLLVSVSLVALYCAARLIWRFSGSNEWELVRQGNGARVYSLKEPGSDLEQIKGSVRVRSTLAGAVAWLQDPDTCKDAGCYEARTVEQVDDELQYVYMRFNMPRPFRSREFVLRVHFHQIPRTREIWVEYAAAPDKAPPNACCFRVTNMNNTWRLTPLGNGEVEIEYAMNMDWGGFIPDMLSNTVRPKYQFMQLQQLQEYLNRDKYRTAKVAFIQEDAAGSPVREGDNAPRVTAQGPAVVP
jgi:hypothetical protein